jgi:hypothetical protein
MTVTLTTADVTASMAGVCETGCCSTFAKCANACYYSPQACLVGLLPGRPAGVRMSWQCQESEVIAPHMLTPPTNPHQNHHEIHWILKFVNNQYLDSPGTLLLLAFSIA